MQDSAVSALPTQPSDTFAASWGWRSITLMLLFTVSMTIVMALSIRLIVDQLGLTIGTAMTSPIVYMVAVGFYLILILSIYIFAARRAGWAAVGLGAAHWSSFILVPPLFILEVVGLLGINKLVERLLGGFENPQIDALTGGQAIGSLELVLLLILVAGLAPFAEELFFRGALYPLLRRQLGPVLAIILNAAVFAGMHFIPPLLPGLFMVGLLLAFLRERSGSIWPSVCLHALQNGLVLIALSLTPIPF